MSYLAVNQAVIFTNIVPIVSVIAGVLVLGEPFSPSALIGIVLILVGVYMVNKVE
jgi:drug/metabolite transporter (DMT)-like permease